MQMREKSHVVKPLLGLMRPYTLQILLCVVLVMLFNGADLIKPWIMEIAVDDYLTPMIAGEPAQTGGFFLFQSLTGLGVSYFLVVVIGALASVFQSRLLARVCQSILNTMRLKLFDHIHRLKLTDLDEIGSGRLLTRRHQRRGGAQRILQRRAHRPVPGHFPADRHHRDDAQHELGGWR